MKTQNKETIKLFVALYKAKQARKDLEKLEADLKEKVKALMGANQVMEAGDFAVTIKQRTRVDIDKKALAVALGDGLKQFEKETTYDVIEIIPTKAA